jgi:hypothetical protein
MKQYRQTFIKLCTALCALQVNTPLKMEVLCIVKLCTQYPANKKPIIVTNSHSWAACSRSTLSNNL